MDGGGGEAETDEHPPPLHGGDLVAVDGSEACLSLTPPKAYCARDGVARETRLELAFNQYKTYEEKIREVFSRRDCWHLPRRRENT
jgi:hypothetical protein